jgi:geranylgeranyl reductase family protein
LSPEPDVLIVGAGPAGSIAALVLARAGARVRLIDRSRFPRDKLCGDTVNPGARAVLDRLGVGQVVEDGVPVEGMIVTGETGVRCEGRYGGPQGRALRRHVLDERLLAAATAAGAGLEDGVIAQGPLVEDGRVVGVTISDGGGRSRSVRASMVIAADGASSRLARAMGLSGHSPRPRRWAVGAYFEQVDMPDAAPACGEMHVRHDRYIGIAPLAGDVTNACVVTADRTALRDPAFLLCDTLRRDSQLALRFRRARQISRPVCLGPLAVDNHACGMPGLLLAGDAAGFIDPMTGDGLRFAFRGGELAAQAVVDGRSDAHGWLREARRREFIAKWRFNRALRSLVSSARAVDFAGHVASVWPALMGYVIRYAGDVS